jgi:Flp pilus assembly secretin CpaC
MSIVFDRIGPSGRRSRLALLVVALLASASSAAQDKSSAASGMVTIILDQAQVMRLPDGVATLVVGNPLIADISIQSGGMIVLTGKGYGVTNLLALDRSGAVLEQKMIQVQGPRDNLMVVYRGVERESYSCTPKCERRITLGDSPSYFDTAIAQTGARTGQAQSGVQASK